MTGPECHLIAVESIEYFFYLLKRINRDSDCILAIDTYKCWETASDTSRYDKSIAKSREQKRMQSIRFLPN